MGSSEVFLGGCSRRRSRAMQRVRAWRSGAYKQIWKEVAGVLPALLMIHSHANNQIEKMFMCLSGLWGVSR